MGTKERTTERKAFKDWFDRQAAHQLAAQIAGVWPRFNSNRFVKLATNNLKGLEFHGRVQQFANALQATLPKDIPRALDILTRSLPTELPDTEAVTDGWLQWPVGQFIADHGVPYFEESMRAMTELTTRFSSEFAIRPFLLERPKETYEYIYSITSHPNAHVRRWCSEGTRPRLPWGRRLPADPASSWPILEALKDDPEIYVRKSVANHSNDLSKEYPDLVVARCRAWQKGATPERTWIIRHALRSLIKAGHPEAMRLLGFGDGKGLRATLRIKPRAVNVGDAVTLNAAIRNTGKTVQRLVVDYLVHFARPSGKPSRKVFKWTVAEVEPGGVLRIEKRHPLRHTTIRTLYPGRHRIEVQVNGARLVAALFELSSDSYDK